MSTVGIKTVLWESIIDNLFSSGFELEQVLINCFGNMFEFVIVVCADAESFWKGHGWFCKTERSSGFTTTLTNIP